MSTIKLTNLVVDASAIRFGFDQLVLAESADLSANKARKIVETNTSKARVARMAGYTALAGEHDRLVMGGCKSEQAWSMVSDAALKLAAKKTDAFRAGLLPKTIAMYAQSATWVVSQGFVSADGKVGAQGFVPTLTEAKMLKAKMPKLARAAKKANLPIADFVARTVKGYKVGDKAIAPMSATKLALSYADAPKPVKGTAGDTLNIDVKSDQPNTLTEAIGMLNACAEQMGNLIAVAYGGTYGADERKTALSAARKIRQHAASIIGKLDPPKPKVQGSTQAPDKVTDQVA